MSKKKNRGASIAPELEQAIMALFKENPTRLLNYKQVSSRLNENFDRQDVEMALNVLAGKELIAEADRGKYHYIHQMTRIEGIIQITAKGSGFLLNESDGEEDIFIAQQDLNKALHGDRVAVQLYAKRKNKRPEGEVVQILQRARTSFVGTLRRERNYAFFIPDDKKLYVDIFIPNENLAGATEDQKVIVEMTDWPEKAKNPFGRVKKILGEIGENETEMHAIVAEFGFPVEFPEGVLMEAEKIPVQIPPDEIKKRRDFRDVLTFTIDPHDAKDFDDALSFRWLENGHVEVGVHIADVSHYVRPGTMLDQDAYDRATSVYLVDRTIPMLPEKLSNGVCSLRPQEEKCTFSAVFELDETGKLHNEWLGKTVIFSDRRFSYEEAQEILEKGEGEYAKELTMLNTMAKNLRDQRFREGAISFETEEVKFRLDETGKPIEVYKKVRKDAHKLIEEFMLLANRKVAEFAYKKNQKSDGGEKDKKQMFPFVYRVHDSPNEEKLIEFNTFIKRFGYQIKTGSDKEIARSFNTLLTEVEGKPEQNILQSMAIRTMAKAFYTTKKAGHYGLAFDHYSHFTSPIRRYPDLMAHRLLEKYLLGENARDLDVSKLEKQCKHSSEMEQKAADAERASVKYKQAEYLQSFIGRVFDGIISGVTDWGIYVELLENKCEGMIRLNTMYDDFYEFDEAQRAVIGKRFKKRFMIGNAVKVQVKKTDPVKRTIDFVFVNR